MGKYIAPLSQKLEKSRIGNKAGSLVFLQKHKMLIPAAYVVLTDAYDAYLDDRDKLLQALKAEIALLPGDSYIVRSSTNIEDSENFSHAGQFLSIPDVQHGHLLNAIVRIYESISSREESDYLKKSTSSSVHFSCALILQKMIKPVLSGVSFSRNPVTGSEEVVIEAVRGYGEDLMQKGMDPMRWRIRKTRVLEGEMDFEYREAPFTGWEEFLRRGIIDDRDDFAKVRNVDVVIIPFSDVSWTHVLCKAGAIVTESGGILSH